MSLKWNLLKIVIALTTVSLATAIGSSASHSLTSEQGDSQASNFEKRVKNIREQLKTTDLKNFNIPISEAESKNIDRQLEQRWCDQRWCNA